MQVNNNNNNEAVTEAPEKPKSLYTKVRESVESGVLTFGKYKGQPLSEVTDEDYLQWIKTCDTNRIVEEQAVGTWKIHFGKYKNLTYNEILEIDQSYCKWLIGIIRSEVVQRYLKVKMEL